MSNPPQEMPEGVEAPPPGTRIMAVVRWLLVALMAGAVVWTVGTSAGLFHGHQAVARRYFCPMHPQIVRDQPGECPICHMTLAPLDDEHSPKGRQMPPGADSVPGLATIDLTPERLQLAGVRTAAVARKPLGGAIKAIGTVTPSERSLAVVSPRFAGWVETLPVTETGRSVRKGQVLATIYSPDVLAAEQELLNAHRFGQSASAANPMPMAVDLEPAARRRLELLGLTKTDIDAVATKGVAPRTVPLRAPRDGQITARRVTQGAYVEPGAPLFEIADLTTVWVVVQVYAADAGRVQEGASAQVTVTGVEGGPRAARVAFIQPTVDATTRTVEVRLELDNPDLRLKPGMYADVSIEGPSTPMLVVPAEAVIDTGVARYVFLARAAGHFEPRLVTVGLRVGDDLAITSGLTEGDQVVTSGSFLLDSESRLQGTVDQAASSTAPMPPMPGMP
jgi:multidrug efflux pump subunit AcrA (membrane-fusion protein)